MNERPSRRAFGHEATVDLDPGSDAGAIGAAITVELCGHWEHEGPCAHPHQSKAEAGADGSVRIRTVFVAAPDEEAAVRARLRAALVRGDLEGPAGTSTWRVVTDAPTELTPDELELGARISR